MKTTTFSLSPGGLNKVRLCAINDTKLETFNVYKNLAWLNEVSFNDAVSVFLSCSGSEMWARRMAEFRPFAMLEKLYETASSLWFALPRGEWIAAFSCLEPHFADESLIEEARLYKEKFGFIFVVFPNSKTSKEMLAICRARFGNSVETELQIAAEEHWKMLERELDKLLEK
ncbi:MAG: 2-oxo-4-hydroxy-4-carboxy-5-ureidoimidazoline decarboxylase [Pyrinomonadaceae bacterium]